MKRVVLVTAIAALVAAACGGGGSSTTPQPIAARALALITDAQSKTVSGNSSKVSLSLRVSTDQGETTATGEGAFDLEHKKGSMHLDVSAAGQQLGLDIVFAGTVLYERFPPEVSSQFPGGKEWLKLDLAELAKVSGVDASQFLSSSPTDPSQTLEYLKAASSDIQDLGTEEVRGASTRHFHFTVDLNKLGSSTGTESALKSVVDLLGRSTFPMDAWIDSDGRARKVQVDFSFQPSGDAGQTTGPVTMTETIEYYDFGTDVNVTLPPESDVIDFSEFLSSLGQSSGSGSSSSYP